MDLYFYDVEFVFEHMVIITNVGFNNPVDEDPFEDQTVIAKAKQMLIDYYKIDPEVLYLQDVIVHERD
jgi:hypothetical protein